MGSRVETPKRPDLGPAAGPSKGCRGRKKVKVLARRDSESTAGPEKFRAEGAARESRARSPAGPSQWPDPGSAAGPLAERGPRAARRRRRDGAKGAGPGRKRTTQNHGKERNFHSRPGAKGGLPGYTGPAPRREDDIRAVHNRLVVEVVDDVREPPWVRTAWCGGPLKDSTHGSRLLPDVRASVSGPPASQGIHARPATCRPASEPRS